MSIEGGCHCGRIRYRIDRTTLDDVATCHCEACRRVTGGTHVTWATVPMAAFSWIRGTPRAHASSDHARRFFCPDCGTHLALHTVRCPDSIDITVGSLDEPDRFPPSRHIWVRSRLPWVALTDGLPAEEGETYPDGGTAQ